MVYRLAILNFEAHLRFSNQKHTFKDALSPGDFLLLSNFRIRLAPHPAVKQDAEFLRSIRDHVSLFLERSVSAKLKNCQTRSILVFVSKHCIYRLHTRPVFIFMLKCSAIKLKHEVFLFVFLILMHPMKI